MGPVFRHMHEFILVFDSKYVRILYLCRDVGRNSKKNSYAVACPSVDVGYTQPWTSNYRLAHIGQLVTRSSCQSTDAVRLLHRIRAGWLQAGRSAVTRAPRSHNIFTTRGWITATTLKQLGNTSQPVLNSVTPVIILRWRQERDTLRIISAHRILYITEFHNFLTSSNIDRLSSLSLTHTQQ